MARLHLTSAQVAEFHTEGFLFFARVFSRDEVALLKAVVDDFTNPNHHFFMRDKAGTVALTMGLEKSETPFRDLARHPAIIEPAKM